MAVSEAKNALAFGFWTALPLLAAIIMRLAVLPVAGVEMVSSDSFMALLGCFGFITRSHSFFHGWEDADKLTVEISRRTAVTTGA